MNNKKGNMNKKKINISKNEYKEGSGDSKRALISIVINTKNCEATLESALKSVNWADEIVVMDMKSDDKTVEIAKKYTEKVYSFEEVGYVEPARKEAIKKTSYDWIFVLDADEEFPKGLEKKLYKLANGNIFVWDIPRKNIIFTKWIKNTGWWPDYQRRFFKKKYLVWSDEIYSVPKAKGKVGRFPAEEKYAILHHNYQTIFQFVERLNRYTSIQAKERSDKKKRESGIESKGEIFQEFSDEFLKRYFRNKGYRDDVHGLSLSLLQSFFQVVIKLKQWEKEGFNNLEGSIDRSLDNFIISLRYWRADVGYKQANSIFTRFIWRIRRKLRI